MYPFNYPTPQNALVSIFGSPASATGVNDQSWIKPPNIGMVWITAVGAGGGGGTGTGNGTFFGFGGGGGSGAMVNVLVPAIFVPPKLDIQIGQGGSGASPSFTQTNTLITFGGLTLIEAESGGRGVNGLAGASSNGSGAGGVAGTSAGSSVQQVFARFIRNITDGAAGFAGSTTSGAISTTSWTIGGGGGNTTSVNGQYGYSVPTESVPGCLTFSPIQTFGGTRRIYDSVAGSNTARYRAPNGAGGGGGASQFATACPGHQGGHGLVVIVAW